MEAAGVIVALPTDERVLNNEPYKKNGFRIGGKVACSSFGTHATFVSAPWKNVFPVPEPLTTKTAAATLIQGLTAVSFSEEAYNIQKGDVILIHAVSGGLGLLLCQLAKLKGATVIGTTSTEEKKALAIENGADHVILYRHEDTVKRTLELTNDLGVHAVFDGVGKDTFDNNFKLIRRKGTILSLGNSSGAVPPFPPLKLSEKNVKLLRPVFPNYVYTPEEAFHYGAETFGLVSKGLLKTRIYKEYPFTAEGVQQAHRDLTSGKTAGKLVIKVAD
jgi:NADPH2:quinone reductase